MPVTVDAAVEDAAEARNRSPIAAGSTVTTRRRPTRRSLEATGRRGGDSSRWDTPPVNGTPRCHGV
jgi:hypothetical protein